MSFIKSVFTNKFSSKLYQWGNTRKIRKNQTRNLKNLLPIKIRIHEKLP